MPTSKDRNENVDAFSDISVGSTISLDSVGSDGVVQSPLPPKGTRSVKSGVKNHKSKAAKTSSPYVSKNTKRRRSVPTHSSSHELWMSALKNGTSTFSTENSPINTWAGPRPTHAKRKNKSGTRQYSDFFEFIDDKSKNHVRSASMSVAEPVVTGGGPALKPAEDYYDELIELKKIINALKTENGVLATKLHRVEEDNMIKNRKIEDYLNPRKQPEDIRRTLTDRKADASSIVNSLKHKLHATERTLREKESELSQLRRDLKMTNIEEMQIQTDIYYQEVQRMQLAVLEMQQNQTYFPEHDALQLQGSDEYSTERPTSPASHEHLQLLKQKCSQLQVENRGLKKDLLMAVENSSKESRKKQLKLDYADMTRGQLLQTIYDLEKKVDVAEDRRKSSSRSEDEYDTRSVEEQVKRKTSRDVEGKLPLRGTTSQKLAQLQDREEELLEQNLKLKNLVEKLKEDRTHYRTVSDELRMKLEKATEDLAKFSDESNRRASTASRRSSTQRKEFDVSNQSGKSEIRETSHSLDHDKAARTLQKQWKRHRDAQKRQKQEEEEKAVMEIQAAVRAHIKRRQQLHKWNDEMEAKVKDNAVIAIQSAFRGHLARRRMQFEETGDEWSHQHGRMTTGTSSDDDESDVRQDDHTLNGKRLSPQSSLEQRSSSGFVRNRSSVIEDTVTTSSKHNQSNSVESDQASPAPTVPVPAPRLAPKKPTPAPRKTRAQMTIAQEEVAPQALTEQETGTTSDVTNVGQRSDTFSESDSDDGVVIGGSLAAPKKIDGKPRTGSFSGRLIDDISEEIEADAGVSSFATPTQISKTRETQERRTNATSPESKPKRSIHEFGESADDDDDDDDDDVVMTSTKTRKEKNSNTSSLSSGKASEHRLKRQVRSVDEFDSVVTSKSPKAMTGSISSHSTENLKSFGYQQRTAQNIAHGVGNSSSDDESDGVVIIPSKKISKKKEAANDVTEDSIKGKKKVKSKKKQKRKQEQVDSEDGTSSTSLSVKERKKDSKRHSLGKISTLESESVQPARKGSLVDSLFSSSTPPSTTRRSSRNLFDYGGDDDEDDDDDDVVMTSSTKKLSSKQKTQPNNDVSNLWGSSGQSSSNKKKQSGSISDSSGVFSTHRRKESPLDELF